MAPQRSHRPKGGFELCIHTCVEGGCVSRETSCVLWHREGGACPRHVRSDRLHPNCNETCHGYKFLKGKSGRGTLPPKQEDLARCAPQNLQRQFAKGKAPAHEPNKSRGKTSGMKSNPSYPSSLFPAPAPASAPAFVSAPIPTPIESEGGNGHSHSTGERGPVRSSVLELLSSAKPNLEAFHPHFVKMGITDGNALRDLLSWPVHVQERMLRVELGGAMSVLQLYGLIAAMHQWKESH
ncbi:hypothetical protein F5J12DRAFT_275448 [Pisolithus orientalis]|uniref:uncharacterized protein n=1 Tax=Pisolithus orientalis TaxID=936130 RepID=UPI00222497C3|nr:uncharacterized protein F5J12DRAFT_275448 [Pisolithus orientalis]KAI5999339.1 hypothetical protein F5J12DRAFT_275448 [Pisolithus orientalis]